MELIKRFKQQSVNNFVIKPVDNVFYSFKSNGYGIQISE